MRLWIALLLIVFATPVCAQTTVGSSSGATAMVNVSDPPDPPSSDPTTSRLVTAPTIAAPGLAAAGVETCLGSASGGLSLMGGGFTFGSTKVDEGCTIRLLARQLFAFGLKNAAVALMCQDTRVAVAMAVAGSPCPSPPVNIGEPLSLLPVDPRLASADALNEPPAVLPGRPPSTSADALGEPAQEPFHISFVAPPFSQQEQAWFDRSSNVN